MRSVSWLALVVGLLLVPASIAIALNEHDTARREAQSHLDDSATTHAAAIEAYFSRARAITRLTGSVAGFQEAMSETGGRTAIVARNSPELQEATRQLAFLERLYPTSIGEACFIVREGGELARVVDGIKAPAKDLSADESNAVFFAPTFAMQHGDVYQAEPYRSPDMKMWVISNSTPIFEPGATRAGAIVHFEVTVESFRRALAVARTGDEDLRIIDTASGAVIADADSSQGRNDPLGDPDDRRFAKLPGHGHATVEGRLAAVKPIAQRPGNANRWVVVATTRDPFPSLLGSLGVGTLALLFGGLALIVVAAIGLRAARRELEEAAATDGLTGLPNRRSLIADLERSAARATADAPKALLLFDLDGFKLYNDTFGHMAGDALLTRLGARLAAAVAPYGQAYRLGGDEFCVLGDGNQTARIEAAASAALVETGEGFAVTSSYGTVVVPAETSDPVEALRIADQRMYQHKGTRHGGAEQQSKAVLLRILFERNPELGEHVGGVADLARDVGTELGLADDELRDLVHAAELHDIGKMAVPDAILNKPGPLDDDEWRFMRTHTLIGERVLAAAPALGTVAKLVRSSHERWDGGGYPDGLTMNEIPLGARIVFACDAFDAIITDRPYSRARNADEAVEELRKNAGSQFDPAVVQAVVTVVARAADRAAQAVSEAQA